MYVTKRNGQLEEIAFDKIVNRLKNLGQDKILNNIDNNACYIDVNYQQLTMKVIDQLYDKIPTSKIDELAAEQCASMYTLHPDYGILAARIIISNHQKKTQESFAEVVDKLYHQYDKHTDQMKPLISLNYFQFVYENQEILDKMIVSERDYLIDYFGFKTLERAYLFSIDGCIVERIQHMWMRVAVVLHMSSNKSLKDKLSFIKESYDLMSLKYFTHATPTLYNAGNSNPQLSSCFLIAMESDSIDGIFNTLSECAKISKYAGGIGLHIHNIRAEGSKIYGTNGTSNGIVPMLRVFNNTARYVDQCVHPKSIIYTTDGPIYIEQCSSGQTQIYNLNGEVETIQNVLEHSYQGDILNIKSSFMLESLCITPEHPVYVLQQNNNNNNIPQWIEAKELQINDLLIFKIPTYSKDISNLSQMDCYMYGLFMSKLYFYFNQQIFISNQYIQTIICKYFENKCVHYTCEYDEISNKYIIKWLHNLNLPFRYNDFIQNDVVNIYHKWLQLPVFKLQYILKGLLQQATNNEIDNSYDLFCNTTMMKSIYFLCLKMGLLCSSDFEKKISILKTTELCNFMDSDLTTDFVMNCNDNGLGLLYIPINSIHIEKYNGLLYDLQMSKQHNYMLSTGIIHNGGGKKGTKKLAQRNEFF